MAHITQTGSIDLVNGTADDDTLTGGSGNDLIRGSGGSDDLAGGEGDDILIAGDLAPLSHTVTLTPINDSGVGGTGRFSQDGDTLTVTLAVSGLEQGQPHPMHIHGLFDAAGEPANSVMPTLALDTDGDGFLELDEGLPAYGPVIISLTEPGGAFQTAEDGTIFYQRSFDLTDATTFNQGFTENDLAELSLREIVVHGLSVEAGDGAGTPGEVDGTAGYKAILPVATGEIELVAGQTEDRTGSTLNGGDGADTLLGGNGDDTLDGGAGDDHLDGGAGDDEASGGAGADLFIFTGGDDIVLDFDFAQDDRIQIAADAGTVHVFGADADDDPNDFLGTLNGDTGTGTGTGTDDGGGGNGTTPDDNPSPGDQIAALDLVHHCDDGDTIANDRVVLAFADGGTLTLVGVNCEDLDSSFFFT